MDALGINIVNMAINLVLFVLFFTLIHKFVLKKLTIVLEERRVTIDNGIQNTFKSKELVDLAQVEHDEIIAKAKVESDMIIAEAKKRAEIEAKELIQKVEVEASAIREKANATLAIQHQKMEVEFNSRVEVSVKAALEKLFRENPEFKK